MNRKVLSQITAYLVAVFVLGLGWTPPLSPQVATAQDTLTASAATPPNPPPESSGEGSSTNTPAPPGDENADRLTLATGRSLSCNVTDCLAGEVTVKLTFMLGGHSSTSQRKYKCSDIDSIQFAAPNIPLAKTIVMEALIEHNGCLAYDIACTPKLTDDPDLTLLSKNQQLAKAVTDLRATRQSYDSLVKTLAEMKRDPARFRFYNPNPRGAGLLTQMDEMTLRVNTAKIEYDAAQATMAVVCDDIIHPSATPQSETYLVGVDLGRLFPTYPEGATSVEKAEARTEAAKYEKSLAGMLVKAKGIVKDVREVGRRLSQARGFHNYQYEVELSVKPVEEYFASAFATNPTFPTANNVYTKVYTNDSLAAKANKGDLLSCAGTMKVSARNINGTTISIMARTLQLEPKP